MNERSYYSSIQEASSFIASVIQEKPVLSIVLGSGLASLTNHISHKKVIPYSEIPNFPEATVLGHKGELIFGRIGGLPILAQSGRLHYYEGYDMKQVTFPIRVFKQLGATHLFIASAVGGIHEDFKAGDITIVEDHINLFPENPLRGRNDIRLGPRFPDMVDAYDPELINLAERIASQKKITLHKSVYAGLTGPNLETKAEYNYLHRIGATVVGMSTVPEVLVAQHMSMKICVFTAITNQCFPTSLIQKVSHEAILDVAKIAEKKISSIVIEMIKDLHE